MVQNAMPFLLTRGYTGHGEALTPETNSFALKLSPYAKSQSPIPTSVQVVQGLVPSKTKFSR